MSRTSRHRATGSCSPSGRHRPRPSRHRGLPEQELAGRHRVSSPSVLRRLGAHRPLAALVGLGVAGLPISMAVAHPTTTHIRLQDAQQTPKPSPPDFPPLRVVPLDSQPAQPSIPPPRLPKISLPDWFASEQRQLPAAVGGSRVVLSARIVSGLQRSDIPGRVLQAYVAAADTENRAAAGCHVSWPVLAAIGYVESDHAIIVGSNRRGWSGVASPSIVGPALNGTNGFPVVRDTDRGALDGDARFDHGIGPMQLLPTSWRKFGASADGGKPNPQSVDDAAWTVARVLCETGADVSDSDGLVRALFAYDHSFHFVSAVIAVATQYSSGTLPGAADARNEASVLAKAGGPA